MDQIGRITPATAEVLSVLLLNTKPVWGLQIIKTTARKAGTVYPILDRLENLGWVTAEWESEESRKGPRRRYYRLIPSATALAADYVKTSESRRATKPARTSPATFQENPAW